MSQMQSPKQRDALAVLQIQRSADGQRRSAVRALGKPLLWLIAAIVLVIAGMGVAIHQGWLGLAEVLTPRPEVSVAVVELELGRSADAVVVATGYLQSRRQAAIGAKAPGRIQEVTVEEGSRVTRGQVLAVLEHADFDAALQAARAALQQARAELAERDAQIAQDERDLHRAENLRRTRGLSVSDYEQAKAKLDVSVARRETLKAAMALAEARVYEAEQQRENMFVRAPFDGTVISKDAEVGESILPGGMGEASGRGSVATLADLDHLEVDCDVKEDFIGRVRVGQPAEVAVDAVPQTRYQGQVRKIIPMGDRARATIKVRVEILDADERLFPEMSSTVYFLPENSRESSQPAGKTVFCPSGAVVRDTQGPFVWQVDTEERVHQVTVKVGQPRQGRVEIESGLEGGERVLVHPPAGLQDGQRVRVAR